MKRLFKCMLAGTLIVMLSACGKNAGMEQSERPEHAETTEPSTISQMEETTQEQEEQVMTNDISFDFPRNHIWEQQRRHWRIFLM